MMSSRDVLVADIGGTNARFALARGSDCRVDAHSVRKYEVAEHPQFESAARAYLDATGAKPQRAVLAVAGHIRDARVEFTNSPWRIDAAAAAATLGLDAVTLVNDFTALSRSLPRLDPKQVEPLGACGAPRPGAAPQQTFGVIGPGTGLGVGGLVQRDDRYYALATEGGHASFAPTDALETEILARLRARFAHVCNEHLLSGPGLLNLYRALADIEGSPADCDDPAQVTAGAEHGDALCVLAAETFCAIFGNVAGDVALTLGAWDGMYLGGGLSPIMLPWLRRGTFRERFAAKDALADDLRKLPVAVVSDTYAALHGAAAIAAQAAAA